ncbi:MAG: CAP domain-containing protein [Trueperaceae bacterium]
MPPQSDVPPQSQGSSPVSSRSAQRPSDTPATGKHAEMLTLVNAARVRGGVCGTVAFSPSQPLRYDAVLERTARKHSEDMNAANVLGHVSPTGSINYPPGAQLRDRINAEGYSWQQIGENVSWNYLIIPELVDAWLASPHHCENILNPAFTEVGFGKAGTFWTQNFGLPLN